MSRPVDDPKPGFFRMRLVKGGPFVGAEIRHGAPRDPETGGIMEERSFMWETIIDGKLARDPSPDPALCRRVRVLLNDLRDPERAKTILGALIAEAEAICQEVGA